MNRRYTDHNHIVESLRACVDAHQDGRLEVKETDARIVALTLEQMEDRNLVEYVDHLFAIDWEANEFFDSPRSSGVQLTLHIHEKLVDRGFELHPAGVNAIAPKQATQPTDLGETLNRVLSPVNETLDIDHWDFCKVDGASYAHGGHITDFEFEYEAFVSL